MSHLPFQSIPADLREEIKMLVEHTVDQRLRDLLGDPDNGLELREELMERLRDQQKRVAAGERGRPMEEVFNELGVD
jgi:hypothetical protein